MKTLHLNIQILLKQLERNVKKERVLYILEHAVKQLFDKQEADIFEADTLKIEFKLFLDEPNECANGSN